MFWCELGHELISLILQLNGTELVHGFKFLPFFTAIDDVRGYTSDVLRINRADIMDNDGFMVPIVSYLIKIVRTHDPAASA